MTLSETLAVKSYEDVHLVHNDVDNNPTTIVELNSDTLTEAGKEAWADVLNAEVVDEYDGIWGFQVQLRGVKARRIDDFSLMLSGNWSAREYDLWVAPDPEDLVTFYLPVTWEVSGYAPVKAVSLEAAVEQFKEHNDNIDLPSESEYSEGSFALSSDDVEYIRLMHEAHLERR